MTLKLRGDFSSGFECCAEIRRQIGSRHTRLTHMRVTNTEDVFFNQLETIENSDQSEMSMVPFALSAAPPIFRLLLVHVIFLIERNINNICCTFTHT